MNNNNAEREELRRRREAEEEAARALKEKTKRAEEAIKKARNEPSSFSATNGGGWAVSFRNEWKRISKAARAKWQAMKTDRLTRRLAKAFAPQTSRAAFRDLTKAQRTETVELTNRLRSTAEKIATLENDKDAAATLNDWAAEVSLAANSFDGAASNAESAEVFSAVGTVEERADGGNLKKSEYFSGTQGSAAPRRAFGGCGCLMIAVVAAGVLSVVVRAPEAVSEKFLFHPNDDPAARRALERLNHRSWRVDFEICVSEESSGCAYGWSILDKNSPLYYSKPSSAPIVLYFGGNAENASRRALDVFENPGPLNGCDFICFDYPGYGVSGGAPSEKTLKSFGLAAYDATAKSFPGRRIVVFGFSLGTGVACYVASERPVDGLILAAPYADGFDLFNNFAPFFYGPARSAVSYRMESVKFAETIDVRPLILATRDDALVPFESSERLAKAFRRGVEFVAQNDVDHNSVWATEEAGAAIVEYLRSLTPSESSKTATKETR